MVTSKISLSNVSSCSTAKMNLKT